MEKDAKNKVIARANELWKEGACMGSGWDEDNPMTTLVEAVTFLVMEDDVLGSEISGEDLYDELIWENVF